MPIYSSIIDNDHSDKKEISIYVRAILCLTCCLYTQCHFQQNFFNNFLSEPVYTPVENILRKKGQKQVKKKAFKINAKIENVGLNED